MNKLTEYDLPLEASKSSVLSRRNRLREIRRRKNTRKFMIFIIATICIVGAVFGGAKVISANSNSYLITVDGQQIAALNTQDDAYAAIEQYLESKSQEMGMEVTVKEEVDIKKVALKDSQPITVSEAAILLENSLTPLVKAASLKINNSTELFLPSEQDAKKVVELAKAFYVNKNDKVSDVKLRENITITPVAKSIKEITRPEIAVNMLLFGAPQQMIHKVESSDETLWTISKQYNVPISVIKQANPGMTSDKLKLGTTINLSKATPMVNVVVVKEVVKTAALPFDVKTKTNSSMLRGKQRVISPGKVGQEKVTLKVVESNGVQISQKRVSSVVTVAPVNKVVEKGTKMVVASRGDGGNGTIGWPLIGRITSRFGNRSLGYHTGLDIDGQTGDTIVAADSGKVVYAARNGSYGNLVKIDHGDGLQTWYAHCSKLYVSSGENVGRGQSIAAVGSTGRSTGSHLHFEVRINGKAYNPLNYLP
ncbi:MAG: peptidoglycan DD-metalloendopeptidase family protein [Bacillota bacterium]|jgi:murein DD-endopeptidase MepM/ murein hydrolase activator NlpD